MTNQIVIENKAKILIVDDDLITSLSIKKTLEKYGFNVIGTAANADEAIHFVKAGQPNLVFMDVNLRGSIDGIETSEKIKELADVPIIFITAYSDHATIERAKKTGPYGYLIKPFDSNELYAAVTTTLYKHSVEKRMIESEERFRLLFEKAPVPYQSLDAEGRIMQLNQAWLKQLGYEYDEVIHHPISEFLVQDHIKLLQERFPKFIATGEVHNVEFDFKHKDGQIVTFEVNGRIGYDLNGNFQQTHCVLHNITERKLAEESLKLSEEKFNKAFQLSPVAMTIQNSEGLFVDINNAFLKMMEYERDEIIGHNGKDLQLWEDEMERIRIQDHYESKNDIHELEVRFKNKSGKPGVGILSAESIMLDGKLAVLSTVLDISDRKTAEITLRESEKKYHSLIQNSQFPIVVASLADGQVLFINKCASKIFEVPEEKAIGLMAMDYWCDKEDRARFIDLLKKNGAVMDFEAELHSESGKQIWTIIFSNIIEFDGVQATMTAFHDITERKLAEKILKESELRFRTILDYTYDWEYWVDENYQVVYMSPSCKRITGYTQNEFISDPGLLGRIIFPEDFDLFDKHHNEVYSYQHENDFIEQEFRIIKKDGSIADIIHICRPIYDENNKFRGRRVSNRDITERKRSELEYRTILKTTIDGFWINNSNGEILEVNNSYCKMIGYSQQELINMCISGLEVNEKLEDTMKHIQKIISTGSDRFETRHRKKDGSIIDVEISTTYRDLDGGRFFVFIRDITERKIVEEEIVMLAQSLRSVNECVSITDMEDKIMFVNEAFMKTYGFGELELLGKHMSIVRPQNNPPEVTKEILPATLHGGWSGELLNKRKDGSEFTIHLSTTIIKNIDGKSLGLIGVAKDITERKRSEKELLEQMNEVSRFNKLMIGRESKMIELKKEINTFLEKEGKPKKYNIQEE